MPRSGRRAVAWTLSLVLTFLALVQGAIAAPTAQAADATCTGGSLYVVAHTDDDLIFQSPDLLGDVSAKRCTRTLYLTAGDAGYGDDYWQSRERGVEAAYAQMAGVSNSWSSSSLSLGGKSVRVRTLNAAPSVSLAFLRLPDGFPLGTGSAEQGYQSLYKLLSGTISSISAVDGSGSYTANQVRNTVLDAMRNKTVSIVRTQDYVSYYGGDDDHYDHHSTSFITRDASGNYSTPHLLRSYLGYNSTTWAANVSGTNLTRKKAAFETYANYDDEVNLDQYYNTYKWLERQYVIASAGASVAANAGPDQSVAAGTRVTLDASGSAGSGTLSYSWAQTGGPTASLSGATTATPTFTPSAVGTYTFRVTASSGGSSASDTVTVTVTSADYLNVARLSGVTVTASSQDAAQPAARVVDGSVLGYPDDSTKEWASVGGGAGTWVQLAWSTPVRVDRVVLYDRPNANDNVTSGTLTFSDGSTVAVGALANSGPTTVNFTARSTSSIRFTANSVSGATENVGLAEFEVYGGANRAPSANAGPDQSVNLGATVSLAGSGSDPDANTTLTYRWTQVSGPSATLSNATVANPTFTPGSSGAYVFRLTVSDGASTATDDVSITVAAVNRAPVANAGPDQLGAAIGTPVTLNGSQSSDPDAGTTLTYQWTPPAGVTLSSRTAAQPTFTPTTAGDLTFTLRVSDGALTSTDTVLIRVAANGAPVANAGPAQTVAAGAQVTLNGSASSDPNGTPLTYAWTQTGGPSVSLTNATTATPTFTPPQGGAYAFRLTVSDGQLSSTANVTITATNRPPTANAGPDASVATGTVVTLQGSGSDPDTGTTLTYAWTAPSGITLANPNSARPTFTAGAGGTYSFTLTVSDGAASATDTVTVTVAGNQPPVANAGTAQTVAAGTLVTLNGTGSSDPNPNTTLTYSWVRKSGPTVTLSGANTATPQFTPTQGGAYVFTLTVSDGSLSDTADVTITATNRAPNANAGSDQAVNVGTQVTLDGSASADPDAGTTLTYAWEQTGGTPAVTLSDADAAKPTFTPATAGTYTFELTVSDGTATDTDTVVVAVGQANGAPVANAGADQTVTGGTTVTLNASASTDPDGDALTYAWTAPAGTTLSSTTAQRPTFTPTRAGTYTFTLRVSDGTLSAEDTVTVTVGNRAPTADAGADKSVAANTAVTLDGSGTDPDAGTTLTYAWRQTAGASVALSSTTIAKPTFTAVSGSYSFELTVSDGTASDTDTVTIAVGANGAPTASAGTDQNVAGGATVTLNGSGTDPEGAALTYAWTQTGGPATVTLSSASAARPTFTAPRGGAYSFRLTVSDGVASATDDVTVTVANRAPTANAGADRTASVGNAVTLSGSGTDPDAGTTLTYKWTAPAGVTLSSTTTANPTFTPSTAGSLTFTLEVSDGTATATDAVVVTVTSANQAPVANAGDDQVVATSTAVTLDGSRSSDANAGTTLAYTWRQTAGATVTLSSTTAPKPTFTPTAAGTYTFELTVSDGSLTAKDSVTVTAQSATNVARIAGVTVTQSSQVANQEGTKAIDGVAQGYPADSSKEWATAGGRAGSWIQLTWSAPVRINRVVLHDRPNTNDRITGGTLVFSDGTTAPVTSLNNAGAATTFTFAARTVTSVRLTITSVSSATENVGLAEFQVWGTSTAPIVNRAPTASAGADQTVAAGTTVTLDGSGTSDPDGNPVTYAWTRTAGPATVSLTGANTARPTFSTNTAGTYTFQLTASDGSLSSTDTVTVLVQARAAVNVARLAGVSVTQSSQATNQQGTKAIDGAAQGWPVDYTREWSTAGGTAGSWIRLAWTTPTAINRIVLYDRPNANDQVLTGTLRFSDGSTVPVGALDNAGGATTITFPTRTVTNVQFTVNSVSAATENIGLAEFEVFEAV